MTDWGDETVKGYVNVMELLRDQKAKPARKKHPPR
jgi:hypothetical protein